MRKKKGSLNISVEAIVILILAIVMLGLGLGFIRGMFGKVSKDIEGKIGEEPEPPTPSSSDPLTLSRSYIIGRPKTSEVIKVGFYNPSANPETVKASADVKCLIDFKNIPSTNRQTVCTGSVTETTACSYASAPAPTCSGTASKCPYLTGVPDTTGFPPAPVDKAGVCTSANCDYDAVTKLCKINTGSLFTCSDPKMKYTVLPLVIDSGETKTFNIIVEIPSEAALGTGLCKIEVGDYSTTLTLKVAK